MTKVLIVSVGGSIDPLVKTIEEHKPEYICFFCSHESVDYVGAIKEKLPAELREKLSDHKILVDDMNDIQHCYQRAVECVRKAEEWGGTCENTIVDFTGGTKVMSAATAIAAVQKNFPFSYVGGDKRTKAGVGTVISGSEKVTLKSNPWGLFAVEERRLAAELFNQYQFKAAEKIAREKIDNPMLDAESRKILKLLGEFSAAYDLWDKFKHNEAIEGLRSASKNLEQFISYPPKKEFEEFHRSVKENLEWLEALQIETEDFKRQSKKLLADLAANAERRAAEGKYDDAVARLYRALEMCSQIGLSEPPLEIENTSNVPPEKIPEDLREEYLNKHSEDGKIKISLVAGFDLLKSVGHPDGIKFSEKTDRNTGQLKSRNHSILAHGLKPVDQKKHEKFLEVFNDFHNPEEDIKFAKFPIV